MAIIFYLQSKKNPAPIYVRVRIGKEVDAKAKTKYSISSEQFVKGAVKKIRVPAGADAEAKNAIHLQNTSLIEIEKNLNSLSNHLTSLLNNKKDFEIINSDWLKDVINPKTEKIAPSRLVDYFEYYITIKGNDIAPSTVKKNRVFKRRIARYEETVKPIYIGNVNLKFVYLFEDWMRDNGYAKNTIIKTIKTIKELCNHAKTRGIDVHKELEQIGRGKDYRYVRSEHITLNEEEIKKIETVSLDDENLCSARDWLVISLYTAQRVSDFLRFKVEDIIDIDGNKFIDFRQKKTDAPIYILLREQVLKIIEKRGEFPPVFSKTAESNSTIYNKLIKLVCKKAGINDLVTVTAMNSATLRYETKTLEKYLAVSTHIGRRSFATNNYTKIDTTFLMSQTGHKSERQFLEYVGKSNTTNALGLAEAFKRLDSFEKKISPMQIIKNGTDS